MTSIQQQLYSALVAAVGGVTWYGSEDNTDRMEPPPISNPPTPYGYVRLTDVFVNVPGDLRQMVQIRVGDKEGRKYSRINPILIRCEVVFARNPTKKFIDTTTGEMIYYPEPAGIAPGTDDLDRPGHVLRVLDVMFRRQVIPAAIASSINH